MKPRDKTERFVADTKIDTSDKRDRQVLSEVLQAHEDFKHRNHRNTTPNLENHNESNTRKLAAAAGVILAVALLVTISDWMTRPAWALEQTIEALKSIRRSTSPGVCTSVAQRRGGIRDLGPAAEWRLSPIGRFPLPEGDYHLCVASEARMSHMSTSDTRTRTGRGLHHGRPQRGTHTFPSGDHVAEFEAMAEDWREEIRKDPQTGKSYVDITFTGPAVKRPRLADPGGRGDQVAHPHRRLVQRGPPGPTSLRVHEARVRPRNP